MVGCGGGVDAEPATPVRAGPQRAFSYVGLDGTAVDTASTRGRVTVVLFFTSYDMMSQMVARRLEELRRQQKPRVNVLGIANEAPKYAPLVDAFKETLGLRYPVVMADPATLTGGGPFGEIRGVPTVVVLDRDGREVWRGEGVPPPGAVERVVSDASSRHAAR